MTANNKIKLFPTESGQYTFNPIIEDSIPLVITNGEDRKSTYTQDWPSYNQAKTNECILFKKLLAELLDLSLTEPEIRKQGRRPFTLKEKIFCLCIKIYNKADLRKASGLLKELNDMGYISRAPSFKTLDLFLNDDSLEQYIDDLIFISSLPLSQIEEIGAIDSSGFSLSRFERWNKYKWGKSTGKEKSWIKAHILIGCKTNTIISGKVTKKNVGDSSMFEDVIGRKPKYFDIDTIVADKAYSSRRIFSFLQKMHIMPYIPYKKNATGRSKGCMLWHKVFSEFKMNNSRFMKKYHNRSNVETTFHMIKKKFGDNVTSKNFISNTNEVKIKLLCHNLCVLIQEMFENNIVIDFADCVKTNNLCKEKEN